MIGSSGWCYHHKDPKFDRKNIVVAPHLFRDSASGRVRWSMWRSSFKKEGRSSFPSRAKYSTPNFSCHWA